MTPTQARLARLALGWTLDDLAARALVGASTARAFEAAVGVGDHAYGRILAALTAAGALFREDEGVAWVGFPAPGHVRSRRPPSRGAGMTWGRREASGRNSADGA